jgi:hypothetical protein
MKTTTLWIEVSDYANMPLTRGEYSKKKPENTWYKYKKVRVILEENLTPTHKDKCEELENENKKRN